MMEAAGALLTFVFLVGTPIAIVLAMKPRSEKSNRKGVERTHEREDRTRGFVRDTVGKVTPREEHAEHVEEQETEAIKQKVEILKRQIERERGDYLDHIKHLIHKEHENYQGKGLPEAGVLISFLEQQNRELEEIVQYTRNPEEIAKRLARKTKKEDKVLKKDVHKTDSTEVEVEGALSHDELKRIKVENRVWREIVNDLDAVAHDAKNIVMVFRKLENVCKSIQDINTAIIGLAQGHGATEGQKLHEVYKIEGDESEKENLIHKAIAYIHTISAEQHEISELLQDTEHAVVEEEHK